LFDAVTIEKREGIERPRSFKDYENIQIDTAAIPDGVEVIDMLK
jgi:hypothetical protein